MRTDSLEENSVQSDKLAHLGEAVRGQPSLAPPGALRVRLMAALEDHKPPARHWWAATRWVAGFGAALLVFVLLWALVRPGVVLGWTASGELPAAYRVYRSPLSGEMQALVGELAAAPTEDSYRYVDPFVLPLARYTYRVEAVAADGRSLARQALVVDAAAALPGQLAVLLASLLVGWGAVTAFKELGTPTLLKKSWDTS